MDYDAVIASAVRDWPYAHQFQRMFQNAEHTIVEAKRQFEPDGWKPVSEWISRAPMHGRYVVWLVIAIEIAADGTLSPLEEPQLYVVEVTVLTRGCVKFKTCHRTHPRYGFVSDSEESDTR